MRSFERTGGHRKAFLQNGEVWTEFHKEPQSSYDLQDQKVEENECIGSGVASEHERGGDSGSVRGNPASRVTGEARMGIDGVGSRRMRFRGGRGKRRRGQG
jgi:hypothetical protein